MVSKMKSNPEGSLKLTRAGYWLMVPSMILLGLALALGAPEEVGSNLGMLALFLTVFYLRYLGLGRNLKDERLAKMAARAMFVSWGFTLLTASLLATLRATFFAGLGPSQVLGNIIVVMISSMAIATERYK